MDQDNLVVELHWAVEPRLWAELAPFYRKLVTRSYLCTPNEALIAREYDWVRDGRALVTARQADGKLVGAFFVDENGQIQFPAVQRGREVEAFTAMIPKTYAAFPVEIWAQTDNSMLSGFCAATGLVDVDDTGRITWRRTS